MEISEEVSVSRWLCQSDQYIVRRKAYRYVTPRDVSMRTRCLFFGVLSSCRSWPFDLDFDMDLYTAAILLCRECKGIWLSLISSLHQKSSGATMFMPEAAIACDWSSPNITYTSALSQRCCRSHIGTMINPTYLAQRTRSCQSYRPSVALSALTDAQRSTGKMPTTE